jgi:hypothetical protein
MVLMMTVMFKAEAKEKTENLCEKHPIYCQIVKNRPKINKKYAIKLSNEIFKATRKHNIPANIYTAILMQESTYKLEAKNCIRGLSEESIEEKVCTDFGISMIHYSTMRRYSFDREKLLTDLEYSVDAGAKVLSWFKEKYSHKEIDWWVRYNCGTKKSIERSTCQIYKNLVERYLP